MEDFELKYITELAQVRSIIGNNCELAHYLLQEHADLAGVISVSQYSKITETPKRTIQDRMSKGKIKYFEVCGKKFPCINL